MRLFATLFPRPSSFGILKADVGSEEEQAAVATLRKTLKAMNDFLVSSSDERGPFLFGEEFSYAESAAAPCAASLHRAARPETPSGSHEVDGGGRLRAAGGVDGGRVLAPIVRRHAPAGGRDLRLVREARRADESYERRRRAKELALSMHDRSHMRR